MSTRTIRGAGTAVLALGLVSTGFTSAQAATPAATTTPISKPAPLGAQALRLLGRPTNSLSLATAPVAIVPPASGLITMSSVCPTGQIRNTVYGHESFEVGLPFPDPTQTDGFTVATGTGAPDGAQWASSSLLADDPVFIHILTASHRAVPQTGKLYLSFSYRGTFGAGSAAALINPAAVNGDWWEPTSTPTWTSVNLDITSQATAAGDGTVEVGFGHVADVATAGSFDVDNVDIYTCVYPPSGVRGDWTSQGTVDLMATRTDGTLWVYEGKGNGTVQAGVKVGGGWAPFTWQGSPGDVNGDRRTDLLARRSDGSLWFYPGKGNGALGAGTRVGGGWNAMTSLATPGDFDLDGRPDVIARRADGSLHLYRTLATGGMVYVRQIGAGWNGMTSIIGMGDLNGDGRGDVVAVRNDGIMFGYLATSTGLAAGKRVGAGWKALSQLTSPGDMTGDGRGDLVGRRADGSLWSYSGKAGGGVNAGIRVGGGWNSMLRIL
jgi:FG-GAP-like repeat